ncbi:MAG: hypothetical protein ACTS5I_17105 [Rhodanobacter sp.]
MSAATQEVLNVLATDQGGAASVLNIDARQVTGFHSLNVTGSVAGDDVLTLNSNVGGSVNYLNLDVSTGDRVNWTGGSAATTVNIDMGAANVAAVGGVVGTAAGDGFAQFVDGAVTTTHDMNQAEIVDLTGLTYASSTIAVLTGNTVVAGAGTDAVNINAAALTGVATAVAILAEAVTITNFAGLAVAGGDAIKLGAPEGATGNAVATTFAGALDIAAVSASFLATGGAGVDIAYINQGAGGNVYAFADLNADDVLSVGDAVVVLVGVGAGVAGSAIAFHAGDIIA